MPDCTIADEHRRKATTAGRLAPTCIIRLIIIVGFLGQLAPQRGPLPVVLLDGVLQVLVEALEGMVVLKALHGNDDLISSDDEAHMLHGKHDGVVSDQNFAGLAGQQVGV